MGFLDKVKGVVNKIKEENQGFLTTTKRINDSTNFCGNVNCGVSNGDFWEGSYISIEDDHAVIYGSNQVDYTFKGEDVESFTIASPIPTVVSVGDKEIEAVSYLITFKDGKKAKADICAGKVADLKMKLNIT